MSSQAASRGSRVEGQLERVRAWAARLESPTTTYHLLVGTTTVLVVFGLVMVLSASMVTSLTATDNPYSRFLNQLAFAGVGLVMLLVASRVPVAWLRRLALPAFAGALALQVLVFTPLGTSVNGNRNWLVLGPVSVQPSEIVKLALIVLGSVILTRKARTMNRLGHVVVPFLFPVTLAATGLVLLGHDLGTVIVMAAIVGGLLFAAGVPGRYFLAALGAMALGAVAMVVTSPNRLQRFDVWLGRDTDIYGAAMQTTHGRFALAEGGWFGVGLGASREKWGGLSEAHNDFIFAVIGEELGLPGTLAVLVLLALLAYACYRLVLRTEDGFVRLVSMGIMCWVVAQAFINIGSVIGLLPVIGVPLPLVSSGGSSLIMTMTALGILISFARAEKGCRDALAARPSIVRRSLAVLPRRGGRR